MQFGRQSPAQWTEHTTQRQTHVWFQKISRSSLIAAMTVAASHILSVVLLVLMSHQNVSQRPALTVLFLMTTGSLSVKSKQGECVGV